MASLDQVRREINANIAGDLKIINDKIKENRDNSQKQMDIAFAQLRTITDSINSIIAKINILETKVESVQAQPSGQLIKTETGKQLAVVYKKIKEEVMKEITEIRADVNTLSTRVEYNDTDTSELVDRYRKATMFSANQDLYDVGDGGRLHLKDSFKTITDGKPQKSDKRVVNEHLQLFYGEDD